jgi:drug/metabolite transporter (DMT)-like permease
LLSILTSTIITLLFRAFTDFRINTFIAILTNYLTCAVIGTLFSYNELTSIDNIVSQNYFPYVLGLGFLFIFIFYAMAKTAQLMGSSVSAVAAKMSLVIPVMYSIWVLDESWSFALILGILLALVSVYLTAKKQKGTQRETTALGVFFVIIIFVGSGAIDIGMKKVEMVLAGYSPYLPVTLIFSVAFITGLMFFFIRYPYFKDHLILQNVIAGICVGIPNFFSIFFLVKGLSSNVLSTSQFFPVNNIGIVVLTSLMSFILFKEKFSKIKILGIGLAIISIFIITWK